MKFFKKVFFSTSIILFAHLTIYAQQQQQNLPVQNNRWAIQQNGSILWKIDGRLPHADHIEMSGEKVSLWVGYRIDTLGLAKITRTVVFPTFRMLPDDTRSHITYTFQDNELPRIYINKKLLKIDNPPGGPAGELPLKVNSINQHGIMRISAQAGNTGLVAIEQSLFPSVDKPLAIERFKLTNISNKPVTVSMEKLRREVTTDSLTSKSSPHTVIMESVNDGSRILKPGQSAFFSICYLATNHPGALSPVDPGAEEKAREKRIADILKPLQLETPDSILNTEFAFAKIRATESIFKTKNGYMHGPGGLSYYAAIWANDQAEYISPYFAFSGDSIGNLSAMNCYRLFARYMNPQYKPIPSSIVAEGDATWNGAGDRGDQAMIAYGASRYALTYGNIDSAQKLWPLITWCLEYSRRHLNEQGVVTSDADELEGRFPAGKANLSTNCLYYDALISAAMLGKQLHAADTLTERYNKQAVLLKANIEKYFGATINGYKTYRYYETNNTLRAWICMPIAMGIFDRSKGTINALFSPQLWTADGLSTEAGKGTFWDRSTLYALRGVLQAGETEKAITFLHYYSRRRLLGEHVPYPVEAYPEGNQRHLSAESGLYCRIFIEGLFGIRPTGLHKFSCTPRLPNNWKTMSLNNIHSFGTVFDLKIDRRSDGKIAIYVQKGTEKKSYIIKNGETAKVQL
ncbi:hypothetical protein [Mucilaginibacter sp. FT3.2]|uniref:hypothetical protein n=1 Tax=Mucilaginibacter sp. FT3.2 TaxID=2723090 RepID=UPI001607AE45|nr:hypothetical protein [Mucilaginibacter sp. FT3.2]MBB6232891.1 hypothetical protein [Mucilaginibacter sp. FT3.2]